MELGKLFNYALFLPQGGGRYGKSCDIVIPFEARIGMEIELTYDDLAWPIVHTVKAIDGRNLYLSDARLQDEGEQINVNPN